MDNYDELYKNSYGGLNDTEGSSPADDFLNKIRNNFTATPSGVDESNSSNYYDTQYAPSKPVQGRDEDVVAIARAIREHESGNKYDAKGGSGETGAFQFMPSTWKDWAGRHLGDENAPMTRENQNKVAYDQIKSWKDKGYNASQIASLWNSGSPDWQGKVGVNKHGVRYDTPAYVSSVMELAKKYAPTAEASNGDVSQETSFTPPTEENKSVGGFISNLGSSALDFGKSLGNVALHPIDTVKNLGKLALGAGEFGLNKLGLADGQGENVDMARGLGNIYKERYGGVDNIGNTLYKDPVGVLADVSALVSGGAGVVSKLGDAGKLGEISSTLSKVAKASDPITYLGKAKNGIAGSKAGQFVKDIPTNILGVTTGEGGGTFRQIYDAGKNLRTGAVDAMRGNVSDVDIINKLDSAVGTLKKEASSYWKELGLDNMTGSLDVSPVVKQMRDGLENLKVAMTPDGGLDFSRSKLRFDTKAQGDIQNIVDTMKDYGSRAGDRLPSGVDTLKQAFSSLYSENRDSRGFVEGMRKSTRDVLKQVKGYDEYTKKYGDIQDMLTQLKTEMSAGNKNASQTWRKLVNTFKQRNTEGRQSILKGLNEKGVSDVIDNIAGYGAKDFFKSSAVSNIGAGGALFTGNPLALPAFSPRAVGETVNFLGKSVGKTKQIVSKARKVKGSNAVKYLGSQSYGKDKITRNATILERSRQGQQESVPQ